MLASDKLLVYFADELPQVVRIGAATLACWSELTPHAQRRIEVRADQILDMVDDREPPPNVRSLIALHASHVSAAAEHAPDVRPERDWRAIVLGAVRAVVGMDLAFISRFDGTDRVICSVSGASPDPLLTVGRRLPLSRGYCAKIAGGELPEVIPDTAQSEVAMRIDETRSFPIGSHLGTTLKMPGGSVFGTLCCLSHKPKPDLGEHHLRAVQTLAELVF